MSAADQAWQEWADERAAPTTPYIRHRDGTPFHAGFLTGFDVGYRRALEDAADAVRDIRENGLPPGVHSGPYASHFETWLRARAAADSRETKD